MNLYTPYRGLLLYHGLGSGKTCTSIAIAEGNRLGIPIVAMTDSNADPLKVTYPVASNDDAVRSIKIILQHLVEPVTAALESTGRAPRKK